MGTENKPIRKICKKSVQLYESNSKKVKRKLEINFVGI